MQILSPFRKRGKCSVVSLNERIRELINPHVEDVNTSHGGIFKEILIGKRIFRVGDKIIQTKNKDEISNGDIGFITKIYIGSDNDSSITIEFTDNRIVDYCVNEMDKIELAYALTIHKSQGSEYGTVIMPMLSSFYIMLRRNLVYTGITRARNKVVLIGQKKALFTAIHKNDVDKRNTILGERIVNYHTSLLKENFKAECECSQIHMNGVR